MIELDTGVIVNARTAADNELKLFDDTPAERVVYPSNTNQFIRVSPGSMVVVTAYGLTTNKVYIDKILISNGTPPVMSGGCTPIITEETSTTLHSVNIPNLTLCSALPYRVINIPGG